MKQEPQSDGDTQLCNSVNCFINRPIGMFKLQNYHFMTMFIWLI